MSTPEIIVNDSELVEPPVVHADRRPSEWLMMLREAWRMGRTKIGVAIFGAIVAARRRRPVGSPRTRRRSSWRRRSRRRPIPKMWLGSDYIGHDVLTRVLYGGRTVILLALAATVIGLVLGVTPRPHHRLRAALDRRDPSCVILDVVLAFPQIVLALLFVSILGPRLWLIVLIVGIGHAPRIARVARAATLEVSQRDFVRAAEAFGIARWKILFNEILPSITSPLLVEFGLRLTYSIGLIAALSFLGFGMQPPAADWGLMINENRIGVIIQPWPVVVPVLLIGILTIGTNLIADGLGRALIGIERDTGVG